MRCAKKQIFANWLLHTLENLGIASHLITRFLSDYSEASALALLDRSLQYKEWIVGVGLVCDERDNPAEKFSKALCNAGALRYKLTTHSNIKQTDIPDHIRRCLDSIKVDRIDHGINILEDESLVADVVERGIDLATCPASNRFVVQSLTSDKIRNMLAQEGQFNKVDIVQPAKNAFEIAWLPVGKNPITGNNCKTMTNNIRCNVQI